jgi:uncharacterized protein (TIGR03382 family)
MHVFVRELVTEHERVCMSGYAREEGFAGWWLGGWVMGWLIEGVGACVSNLRSGGASVDGGCGAAGGVGGGGTGGAGLWNVFFVLLRRR